MSKFHKTNVIETKSTDCNLPFSPSRAHVVPGRDLSVVLGLAMLRRHRGCVVLVAKLCCHASALLGCRARSLGGSAHGLGMRPSPAWSISINMDALVWCSQCTRSGGGAAVVDPPGLATLVASGSRSARPAYIAWSSCASYGVSSWG
jgi:hypothetical protein